MHIEKMEHCVKCKKTYDQYEYDMQYCTDCNKKHAPQVEAQEGE